MKSRIGQWVLVNGQIGRVFGIWPKRGCANVALDFERRNGKLQISRADIYPFCMIEELRGKPCQKPQ